MSADDLGDLICKYLSISYLTKVYYKAFKGIVVMLMMVVLIDLSSVVMVMVMMMVNLMA